MHKTTTKEATKRETQAIMAAQDHTSTSAMPLMEVDHLACSTVNKNQLEWLDKMLEQRTRQQISKLITRI